MEPKNVMNTLSPSAYARIAGVLYLVIAVAAIIAHIYMPGELIVAGDAAATAQNIAANDTLFRFGGVGAELVILLCEVVLTVILYVLLKPVNKTLSLLAAVSRLAMTTIHGLNLVNYFFVLQLTTGNGFPGVFEPAQINSLVTLFLDAHSYGFTLGIAFLVLHVFALGYLIVRSTYIPRILGVFFLIAGFGYAFDSFALLLVSGYDTTPALVALPITISEIAFPIWLLVKGVNRERWQQRTVALEAA